MIGIVLASVLGVLAFICLLGYGGFIPRRPPCRCTDWEPYGRFRDGCPRHDPWA